MMQMYESFTMGLLSAVDFSIHYLKPKKLQENKENLNFSSKNEKIALVLGNERYKEKIDDFGSFLKKDKISVFTYKNLKRECFKKVLQNLIKSNQLKLCFFYIGGEETFFVDALKFFC